MSTTDFQRGDLFSASPGSGNHEQEPRVGRTSDVVRSGVGGVLPPVLDACCSTRAFWFEKMDARTLFMDKRNEECPIKPDRSHPARNLIIAPDVVADFTAMPFPDESFWHVVFDPPHVRFGERSVMAKAYGTLGGVDWRELLRGGFTECFRVLKPHGTLIFKWCEWEIPLSDVLKLTPHAPLYGHISRKRAQTHWCAFLKGGGGAEQEANNGTCEAQSGAGSPNVQDQRQNPAPPTP